MSEYEIGRDLQDLRSRIEALEGGAHGHGARSLAAGRKERFRVAPGLDAQKAPVIWKQHKDAHLPPYYNRLLGFPPTLKLDSAVSQTWTCTPEPLIITVVWDRGGTDEWFRLVGQTFTIVKATDPNTGTVSAAATYEARLISAGKASNTKIDEPMYFDITLRNAQGGPIAYPSPPQGNIVWASCHDNTDLTLGGSFSPALYEIVAGATWDIPNFRVGGC
jgi:hypothetical protein